jgi:hypothetical protein
VSNGIHSTYQRRSDDKKKWAPIRSSPTIDGLLTAFHSGPSLDDFYYDTRDATPLMFRPTFRSSVRYISHRAIKQLLISFQLTLLHRPTPSKLLTSRVSAYRYLTQEARATIEKATKSSPVVLFMKGTPAEPQCGFSRAVVQILDLQGVTPDKMNTFNVLADQELRSGIKEFSFVVLRLCSLDFV